MTDFGKALRAARLNWGLTLREVAEHLGVSIAYLSDVEAGRRAPLTPERVKSVARFLKAPRLIGAAARSRMTLDLSDLSPEQRELVALFVESLKGSRR